MSTLISRHPFMLPYIVQERAEALLWSEHFPYGTPYSSPFWTPSFKDWRFEQQQLEQNGDTTKISCHQKSGAGSTDPVAREVTRETVARLRTEVCC